MLITKNTGDWRPEPMLIGLDPDIRIKPQEWAHCHSSAETKKMFETLTYFCTLPR